jgi:hypothetical protein
MITVPSLMVVGRDIGIQELVPLHNHSIVVSPYMSQFHAAYAVRASSVPVAVGTRAERPMNALPLAKEWLPPAERVKDLRPTKQELLDALEQHNLFGMKIDILDSGSGDMRGTLSYSQYELDNLPLGLRHLKTLDDILEYDVDALWKTVFGSRERASYDQLRVLCKYDVFYDYGRCAYVKRVYAKEPINKEPHPFSTVRPQPIIGKPEELRPSTPKRVWIDAL